MSWLALSVAACDTRAAADSQALLELERMAFVPAGSVGELSPSLRAGPLGLPQALLVDMFEVTRGEWLRYQAQVAEVDAQLLGATSDWDATTHAWPATYMTHAEADDFARWRGMRLLSSGEWLYCAIGRERRPYPWGHYAQASIANTLELGLERPAPVGTFEAGRSPQSCYDLLGNVAEWVSDCVPGDALALGGAHASVLGGSFRAYARPIFAARPGAGQSEFFAQTLPRASRADDIGLRCAAPAAEYLWAHASEWGEGAQVRARLVALGRRWGRRALSVVEALATRADAPPSLDAIAEGARQ